MNIVIAHLYYDLCNLYGESGNVKALKYQLESQGANVLVKFVTIDEEINFDKYDIVYIGAGTENNQSIVLKHLMKYKDDIKKCIKNNKFFLITGNSIELFGKYILDEKGIKQKALGIFDYHAKRETFRIVDEALFKAPFLEKPVIGFQNQGSVMLDLKTPMFKVINGVGSFPKSNFEGINENNFYGTYLIGPVLIRNPEFLKYLVKKIIISKNDKFKFKKFKMELETCAYDAFINTHYKKQLEGKN